MKFSAPNQPDSSAAGPNSNHPQGWRIDDDGDLPADGRRRAPDFYRVAEARISRRKFLGTSAAALTGVVAAAFVPGANAARADDSAPFAEVRDSQPESVRVPDGHRAQVLLRWGDPIFADEAESFDPAELTPESQRRRFGYNNDFVGFIPLEKSSRRGLLAVNHEYTQSHLMWPGSPRADEISPRQMQAEIAAHGMSVVEIEKNRAGWSVVRGSPRNRRITPETPMAVAGPAAGHARMRASFSPDGIRSRGTVNNCAGGITPWGTALSGEENIQSHFTGDPENAGAESENLKRLGFGRPRHFWGKHDSRWDCEKDPRAPNHFGWVVEVDATDPNSVPKKRTALGRFRHEGCAVFVNGDGRAVAYTGDDARFEYVYRFVSAKRFRPGDRARNMTLLDDGELSAARFSEDGEVEWLPLVHGRGPLTAENGFGSQADVLLETRRAADLLGATPMDRPEDAEVNPATGSVFVMLTNNTRRKPDGLNGPNPRAANAFGHIVEMIPPDGDHAAARFAWDLFILAGPRDSGSYHPATTEAGLFANPDNCAFDNQGRIWIATDGAYRTMGIADGVWVCDATGPGRALTRRFLATPPEAELCGPCFTPDNRSFFCAVQHPGERGTFDRPTTRWPDFQKGMPPRPSVVAVSREDGGTVGG